MIRKDRSQRFNTSLILVRATIQIQKHHNMLFFRKKKKINNVTVKPANAQAPSVIHVDNSSNDLLVQAAILGMLSNSNDSHTAPASEPSSHSSCGTPALDSSSHSSCSAPSSCGGSSSCGGGGGD